MNDCISRKAAIDALANELYHNEEDYRTAVKAIGGLPSAEPDNDMIHLQKEQAYLQGWEEGREALKQETEI